MLPSLHNIVLSPSNALYVASLFQCHLLLTLTALSMYARALSNCPLWSSYSPCCTITRTVHQSLSVASRAGDLLSTDLLFSKSDYLYCVGISYHCIYCSNFHIMYCGLLSLFFEGGFTYDVHRDGRMEVIRARLRDDGEESKKIIILRTSRVICFQPVFDHGGPDVLLADGRGDLPVAVDVLLHPT